MESRIDLAKYFNKLGFRVGAEIGVADGRYSEILCQEIPDLKLYCIDLWRPYEKCWRTKESQDKAYLDAINRLSPYNTKMLVLPSLEASLEIPNESLDFVFIDGGHTFNDVMLDIILWTKKVGPGGIVSGHDYCHFANSGVIEAVNKYCEVNRIELKLINRNNKNHKDDRQPCWWFKK
jgi:predicted O-methyltransferase YrrM